MSGALTIREATAEDERSWSALWRGYCTFYEVEVSAEATAKTWRRILDPKSRLFCLLAGDSDGLTVGFANVVVHANTWSESPDGYLEDLYVAQSARNQGAGRALIEAVIEQGRKRNWRKVFWHTQHDNTRARALYDRFSEAGPFVRYDVTLG